MKTKAFLILSLSLFLVVSLPAQRPKKAEKAFEAAQTAFAQHDYYKALRQVRKTLELCPNDPEAWMLKGEIGMETRDTDLALQSYEKVLASDSLFFPPVALTLARLYDQKMRYAEEAELLRWFQNAAPGNQANDEKAATMLRGALFREEAVARPVEFNPENLGEGVNTANEEYVNGLELTGMELLFTRRFSATQQRFQAEGLFVSRSAEGVWYEANRLLVAPELDDHIGAAFITYQGDQMYFTVCGGIDRHHQGCDLFVADRAEGYWHSPRTMGQEVNDPAWDSQPCLNLAGDELFFASKRNGNSDLYHCLRNEDGSWGAPESLGPVVNTKGTEMAPFLHPDGKTLYFASDTHTGMGGYDLFMSRRDDQGVWSEPVNLGYPINTPGDEINFLVAADGHTAFLSSAREGGFGGYDIYTFQMKQDELQPEPVNVYENLVEDLQPGTVLRLVNIQFEFNSDGLRPESEEGLAMLAAFLRNHPDLHVELAGHTDNVGSDAYNLTLSESRAQVVLQALVKRGIDANRMTAKGYGATKPIYPNDTEEHRALNRRTEMVVL